MSDMILVTIDRDECIECAICWSSCPDVFEAGDDGLSQITAEYRADGDTARGFVPAAMEDCVTEAAEGCPVAIIHVGE
jgi:ferredoxin